MNNRLSPTFSKSIIHALSPSAIRQNNYVVCTQKARLLPKTGPQPPLKVEPRPSYNRVPRLLPLHMPTSSNFHGSVTRDYPSPALNGPILGGQPVPSRRRRLSPHISLIWVNSPLIRGHVPPTAHTELRNSVGVASQTD